MINLILYISNIDLTSKINKNIKYYIKISNLLSITIYSSIFLFKYF